MTTGFTAKKFTKNAYVQMQSGVYKTAQNGKKYGEGIIQLGGEVRRNDTFGKAEVGVGTNLNAKLKVGHEFDLGKNIGLELSGKTDYVRNNYKTNRNGTVYHSSTINANNNQIKTEINKKYSSKYNDGYFKAGGEAMLNFKGKKGKVGIGVEGGYRTDFTPNRNINIQDNAHIGDTNISQNRNYEVSRKNSGGYITPTFKGELNLGESGKWQAIANADMYGGQAGIRYNF